jgi:hypothetical protein
MNFSFILFVLLFPIKVFTLSNAPQIAFDTGTPPDAFGVDGFDISSSQFVAQRFFNNIDAPLLSIDVFFFGSRNNITISLCKGNESIPLFENPLETWSLFVNTDAFSPIRYTMNSTNTPELEFGNFFWIIASSTDDPQQCASWAMSNTISFSSMTDSTGQWQIGCSSNAAAVRVTLAVLPMQQPILQPIGIRKPYDLQFSSSWVHPGVFISGEQLSYVKSQLHVEPFSTAFSNLIASEYANTSWELKGPPSDLIIDCGGYDKPDHGCSDEDFDAVAAYTQALLYSLTGNIANAQTAIRIMDAYAHVKAYTNSNAPLQAAWSASKWTRSAEIIKHSNASWPSTSSTAFVDFLKHVLLPHIINGSNSNGNWELSMIEGIFGISVLCEDETLFKIATDFWTSRIPAYFYNMQTDGPKPVPLPHRPGGQGPPNTQGWYGQDVFDNSIDGLCQELCRDMEHTQMGLSAALNAAETASIQGLNLFAKEETRLSLALEFHANILLGVKPGENVCRNKGVVDATVTYPTYEVGYNALHNRMKIELPNSYKHIINDVRTIKLPVNRWMNAWETLTHGNSP